MVDAPVLAALYPAQTRLLVAVVLAGLFATIAPKRSPHPLAVVVIAAFVAIWLFGATLIWWVPSPIEDALRSRTHRLGGNGAAGLR